MTPLEKFERAILCAVATVIIAAGSLGAAWAILWWREPGTLDATLIDFTAPLALLFAAVAWPPMAFLLPARGFARNGLRVGAVTILATAFACLFAWPLCPFVGLVSGLVTMVWCHCHEQPLQQPS